MKKNDLACLNQAVEYFEDILKYLPDLKDPDLGRCDWSRVAALRAAYIVSLEVLEDRTYTMDDETITLSNNTVNKLRTYAEIE